jgi:short-subunit dehydrogenase
MTISASSIQPHDWALVTGASSGIGREFCLRLAEVGVSLVLVARRSELLDTLASELAERYGIKTLVMAQDLSDPIAPSRIRQQVDEAGVRIKLLINNAAAGRWGPFEASTPEVYARMIQLNVGALTAMCMEFLTQLSSHPKSAVINVSSQAAYQPVPYMAVYAATKAYVQNFSLALYEEWRSRGIHVQTLIPGPSATEFDAKAGAYESALLERRPPMEAVQAALAHLGEGQPVVTTAKGVWKQRLFAGLFPPKMVVREVAKMFKPPSGK